MAFCVLLHNNFLFIYVKNRSDLSPDHRWSLLLLNAGVVTGE